MLVQTVFEKWLDFQIQTSVKVCMDKFSGVLLNTQFGVEILQDCANQWLILPA